MSWDTSYLWTNPDHDMITRQSRMFWDLTRTTLTTESNYQRMLWKQGEENLISNSITHNLISYQVENAEQIRQITVSISTVCYAASLNQPTETTGSTEIVPQKRIPSSAIAFLPVLHRSNPRGEQLPDFSVLQSDPRYAKAEFDRIVKLHSE